MEQTVSVIETFENEALVRGVRASACGGCAGKSSCNTLGSWVERFADMRVENRIGARIGDQVVIEVPDGQLLKATFRLYGLPMLAFVMAGLLGHQLALALQLASADLWATAAALAGVALTYAWIMSGNKSQTGPMGRIVRVEHRGIIPLKPV